MIPPRWSLGRSNPTYRRSDRWRRRRDKGGVTCPRTTRRATPNGCGRPHHRRAGPVRRGPLKLGSAGPLTLGSFSDAAREYPHVKTPNEKAEYERHSGPVRRTLDQARRMRSAQSAGTAFRRTAWTRRLSVRQTLWNAEGSSSEPQPSLDSLTGLATGTTLTRICIAASA